jgi:pyruvate formate lyase activating enzyme
VLDNLRWLLSHEGMAERIIVRLPHIPNHNTQDDVDRSRALLEEMGVKHFDEFNYLLPEK